MDSKYNNVGPYKRRIWVERQEEKIAMVRHRQRLELGCYKSKITKNHWQQLEDRKGMEKFFPRDSEGHTALCTL